jgi:hypothetical protein
MTPDAIFSILNLIAMGGWILLIALPRFRVVADLITAAIVPGLFALAYAAILVTKWGQGDGGFSSLTGVAQLFANPWLLLAGWAHYLAFDLLVGSWEVRDARSRGIPHLLVVPCLLLTFLFGPVGWLLYIALRAVRGQGMSAAAT